MKCPKCGNVMVGNSKYCGNCGEEVLFNSLKESEDDEYLPKKHKKGLIALIVAICIVLLLGGIVIFSTSFFLSRPKNVFTSMINEIADDLLDDNDRSINADTLSLDLELKGKIDVAIDYDESMQMFDIFNNMDFKMKYQQDFKSNKMLINFTGNYKKKEFLDMNYYNVDNKNYVYLNGLYDKYIELDDEDSILSDDANYTDEYRVIVDEIRKTLVNNLDDSNFSSVNESVMIKGNEVNAKKNTLTIDYNLFKSFITDLKSKKNFIESASALFEIDTDEVKLALDDLLEERRLANDILISLYIKDSKVLKVSFEVKDELLWNMTIVDDNTIDYNVTADNSETIGGTIKIKEDKNKTTIDINAHDVTGIVNISFTCNVSVNVNEKLEDIKIGKVIKSSDINEKETAKIQENMIKNEGIMALIESISSFVVTDTDM